MHEKKPSIACAQKSVAAIAAMCIKPILTAPLLIRELSKLRTQFLKNPFRHSKENGAKAFVVLKGLGHLFIKDKGLRTASLNPFWYVHSTSLLVSYRGGSSQHASSSIFYRTAYRWYNAHVLYSSVLELYPPFLVEVKNEAYRRAIADCLHFILP